MPNIAGYPSAVISGSPGRTVRIQGGGTSGPPQFTPLDIPDIVFWFDANVGITLNGANVSQWDDRSANGNNLLQVNAADQPLYVIPGGGAPNLLRFDALSDNMMTAAYAGGDKAQVNVFLFTAKFNTVGSGGYLFDGIESTKRNAFTDFAGSLLSLYAGSSAISSETQDLNKHVFMAVFNVASSRIYVDGGTSTMLNAGNQVMSGLTVGARFAGAFSNVDVFEGSMHNRDLTTVEKDELGNYFASKHGLTWTNITP